jgi:hypothetical protein
MNQRFDMVALLIIISETFGERVAKPALMSVFFYLFTDEWY